MKKLIIIYHPYKEECFTTSTNVNEGGKEYKLVDVIERIEGGVHISYIEDGQREHEYYCNMPYLMNEWVI